jgi:hypothetical protein
MSQLTAIRLLDANEPAGPLLEAVRNIAEGQLNNSTYLVESGSFRQVPNAPFAYWVSENIRNLFNELPAFEGDGRTVKQGLASADDFRFVRTTWETAVTEINDDSGIWFPFAKGGSYSTFYADVHLMVNWETDGEEMNAFSGSVIRNPNFYFRFGLTWSDRTTKLFSAKIWPSGGVFSTKGSCGFFDDDNTLALGLMNSRVFNGFLSMMVGAAGAAARSYQVGTLGRVPFPSQGDDNKKAQVTELSTSAWSLKRSTDTANQTSHAFYAPALSPGQFGSRNKKTTTA